MFEPEIKTSRIAASKALAAILKEIPIWEGSHSEDEDDKVIWPQESLALFTWQKVNEHGKANQIIQEEKVID